MRLFRKLRQRWNLSCRANVEGRLPAAYQRLKICGRGRFAFGKDVSFGWESSPAFASTYGYLEARFENTAIQIGDGCIFSNDAAIVSEHEGQGPSISIGRRCVFGVGFRCYDSDFHGLKADERHNRQAIRTSPVSIGDDCFFGERCMVLKGVQLGARCVVGAGSVVTKSFPDDSVVAGNPARLVRTMPQGARD